MERDVYLYFNEGNGGDASGDAVVYPASKFLGMTAASTVACDLSFEAMTGNAADDVVQLANYSGGFKAACEGMANIMNASRGGMQVVRDEDNAIIHDELLRTVGSITGCVVTLDT